MHRKKKIPLNFIIIFVVAFVLAIAAVSLAPIPDKYQMISFFVLVPLISFGGIWLVSMGKKRGTGSRRRLKRK